MYINLYHVKLIPVGPKLILREDPLGGYEKSSKRKVLWFTHPLKHQTQGNTFLLFSEILHDVHCQMEFPGKVTLTLRLGCRTFIVVAPDCHLRAGREEAGQGRGG